MLVLTNMWQVIKICLLLAECVTKEVIIMAGELKSEWGKREATEVPILLKMKFFRFTKPIYPQQASTEYLLSVSTRLQLGNAVRNKDLDFVLLNGILSSGIVHFLLQRFLNLFASQSDIHTQRLNGREFSLLAHYPNGCKGPGRARLTSRQELHLNLSSGWHGF